MMTWSAWPDDQRAATEVPRNSGHPPPLLGRADVRLGTHITSLSADEPGKAELNDDLLAASLVVTDDEQLTGDVLAKVDMTLPRLLRYERPGRTHPGQVTVYSPVGLPPSAYPCRTSSPPGTSTNALAPAHSAPTSTWSAESSHSTIVYRHVTYCGLGASLGHLPGWNRTQPGCARDVSRIWHGDAMASESRHISVLVERSRDVVYDYVLAPANLPEWASGLGSSVEEVDGRWVAASPTGRITFAFVPRNEYGVLDHHVTLPAGEVVYNPMRVIADADQCEVVFTLRRRRGMSDEEFQRDAQAVATDLAALKRVLERT